LDLQIKKLDYPSASAVEYFDGKLYVMGDDATNLLILDTNLNTLDSILVISHPGRRIPKDIKPDIEASAINDDNLYMFGSGSLSPFRNLMLRYNFETKEIDSFRLEKMYSQIKQRGVEEINIEGACFFNNEELFINRGNKSYRHNQLIAVGKGVITFEDQKDTSLFKGISGLCYAKQGDLLIMTVSTENTRNSYDDGEIGKSFLWIINNISTKLHSKMISPDRIIDLEETDQRFKKQKIESATVIRETTERIKLVLVADNDNGSSTIFKMSIKRD